MEYSFEEITRTLLSRTPLPSLLAPPPTDHSKRVSSTPWNQTVHNEILQLQKNSTTPLFAIASLHLFNDDIGSCHDIVEKHSGHDIADYLHYLLHRREGDYWNAKWWVRQLKSQEFKSVYLSEKYNLFGNQKNTNDLSNSAQLVEAQKRAQTFVDRCEQAERQEDEEEKNLLKQMQWDEMKTVFGFARR
ncbi:unnamed protein product [Rotaria socialis]|uniref:Uncharacterized protein n=1 Tax=Rotaria socialis TaxID=392032 RepID=A0A818ATM3_9BILA|nr:unnamed protein product [Rotaria socialis]CAF3408506.1 unnamed protein product [Rotaria socialis]CAF3476965.1 unnamed protein product [Rotaria socialis]CAF3512669.1 unnamed protein product [Rotaria socialis]CAF4275281.1 unnamed protein product [Rotaria socialis]